MAALCLTTTSRRSPLSPWCCVSVVAANFRLFQFHVDTFFSQTLTLCSTLTRIAQNDFWPHNVYVYFLCGLMCTWIHEFVAELICMRFFSDVLTYCVMLQAFICYCSSSDVYDVRARACVLFIGIVQRN